MNFPLYIAILLGVVEGLTEFIPVSSTGHLIFVGELLGMHGKLASTFEVVIQLGAILAVVWLYRGRLFGMLRRSPDNSAQMRGYAGFMKLVVASIPAFVIGFLLHDFIKRSLFSSTTVAWALIVGGVVLAVIERLTKPPKTVNLDQISMRQCLGVGFFQCAALWPGMSRSGSTIVGGMLLGMDRRTSAEFSFLIAVPVMFGATALDLLKSVSDFSSSDITFFAIGLLTAFFTALLSIKWFLNVLQHHTLRSFGLYRIILGLIILSDFL